MRSGRPLITSCPCLGKRRLPGLWSTLPLAAALPSLALGKVQRLAALVPAAGRAGCAIHLSFALPGAILTIPFALPVAPVLPALSHLGLRRVPIQGHRSPGALRAVAGRRLRRLLLSFRRLSLATATAARANTRALAVALAVSQAFIVALPFAKALLAAFWWALLDHVGGGLVVVRGIHFLPLPLRLLPVALSRLGVSWGAIFFGLWRLGLRHRVTGHA
mmetsp:Transcript_24165/g.52740  ORF Transcript_24165/g.52740 Transcript_24165/m.52740 type:complete len:219 (-) Transcript_24165:82-738(-)